MLFFFLHPALLCPLLYLVLVQCFQCWELFLTHTSIGLLDDLVQDEELDLNFLMSQATMFLLCVTYADIRIHLYWPGSDHHINPTLPPCEWHLALEGFQGELWRRILECGVRIRIGWTMVWNTNVTFQVLGFEGTDPRCVGANGKIPRGSWSPNNLSHQSGLYFEI